MIDSLLSGIQNDQVLHEREQVRIKRLFDQRVQAKIDRLPIQIGHQLSKDDTIFTVDSIVWDDAQRCVVYKLKYDSKTPLYIGYSDIETFEGVLRVKLNDLDQFTYLTKYTCNRTACQATQSPAWYWDKTMHAYYCEKCAKLINSRNGDIVHNREKDIMEPLCIPISKESEKNEV